MTLYELTGGFLELWDMIDDPDVDEAVILDTLEAIDGEIEDKADGYATVIAEAKGKADTIKAEIDRLTARKKAVENNIDRMKKSLQNAMELTGKTKFKTALFSFGIQKNPASVSIEEGAKIPERYLIPQEPKVDKRQLIADLKEGAEVEGCTLTQSESLRIR